MKIIIAGYGFVGKAVFNALKPKHEVVIVDPQYTSTLVEHHPDADGIIICVPTPSLENGGCDCSRIANVLDTVPIFMPVLIKSTVTPAVVDTLAEIYKDHSLTYNPEFFWQDLFSTVLDKCKIYFTCSDVEASMVKYAVNSFLATKVAFFNNLYDLCQANGAEYSIVRQIVTQDTRIGSSHTLVPGVNGERGFGGHCFPKDTEALLHYAKSVGVNLDVLKSAVESNQTARKSLDI